MERKSAWRCSLLLLNLFLLVVICSPRVHADILWQHQPTGSLSAWMMSGTSLAALATVTPSTVSDPNWKVAGVADFNGDGYLDILWQHQPTGSLSVWLMNGTTLETLAVVTPNVVSDPNWKVAGVADFNGDGHPDLLWQHQATGSLSAWMMNETTLVRLATVNPGVVSDTNWKIVGVGDFNNDGHPDLLWQHQPEGSLSAWLMNGTGLVALATVTPSGVSDTDWKIVGVSKIPNTTWYSLIEGNAPFPYAAGVRVSAQVYTTPITDQVTVEAVTVTDAIGGYKLFVEPGNYRVVSWKDGCSTAGWLLDGPIPAPAGTVSVINPSGGCAPSSTVSVTGTVTIQGADQEQYATVSIRQDVLMTVHHLVGTVPVELKSFNVANGGSFTIDLADGNYTAVISVFGKGTITQQFNLSLGLPADLGNIIFY